MAAKMNYYVVSLMPEYEDTVGPFTRAAAVRSARKQTKAGHMSFIKFLDHKTNVSGWLHPYGGMSRDRHPWIL